MITVNRVNKYTVFGRVFDNLTIITEILIAMNRLLTTALSLFVCALVVAQQPENNEIKSIGNYISIDQKCKIPVSNNFSELEVVDKVFIRMDLIMSIVIQANVPERNPKESERSRVTVTTSEKIVHYVPGVSAKAMAPSYKPYVFIFNDATSAESFAMNLAKLCSGIRR